MQKAVTCESYVQLQGGLHRQVFLGTVRELRLVSRKLEMRIHKRIISLSLSLSLALSHYRLHVYHI